MDKVFHAQLAYPDAGRFRIHGILEQKMGDDLPSERTVGRAIVNGHLQFPNFGQIEFPRPAVL